MLRRQIIHCRNRETNFWNKFFREREKQINVKRVIIDDYERKDKEKVCLHGIHPLQRVRDGLIKYIQYIQIQYNDTLTYD